jgi:hypothetical protein
MAEPSEQDKYLRELNEDLRYSAEKFDGQTLAISGAALGFSLSFIKDIVPFQNSIFPGGYISLRYYLSFQFCLAFCPIT